MLVAQGDGLGAVVLVVEDGDEDAAAAGPLADGGLVALDLDGGAQVVDVRDGEGLEGGDAGRVQARGLGGAVDEARADVVVRLGGEGEGADGAEVGEAGDGDEGGAGVGHFCFYCSVIN